MDGTSETDAIGRRVRLVTRQCGNAKCGKEFTGHYNRRYCSDPCARHASYVRNDGRNAQTPEQKKAHRLQARYGLSLEALQERIEAQNGLCAICGEVPGQWHVDHCHETGALRDMLCRGCNLGIGFLQDDVAVLESAIEYLRRHRGSV